MNWLKSVKPSVTLPCSSTLPICTPNLLPSVIVKYFVVLGLLIWGTACSITSFAAANSITLPFFLITIPDKPAKVISTSVVPVSVNLSIGLYSDTAPSLRTKEEILFLP